LDEGFCSTWIWSGLGVRGSEGAEEGGEGSEKRSSAASAGEGESIAAGRPPPRAALPIRCIHCICGQASAQGRRCSWDVTRAYGAEKATLSVESWSACAAGEDLELPALLELLLGVAVVQLVGPGATRVHGAARAPRRRRHEGRHRSVAARTAPGARHAGRFRVQK
jgi:hypothetical protein